MLIGIPEIEGKQSAPSPDADDREGDLNLDLDSSTWEEDISVKNNAVVRASFPLQPGSVRYVLDASDQVSHAPHP